MKDNLTALSSVSGLFTSAHRRALSISGGGEVVHQCSYHLARRQLSELHQLSNDRDQQGGVWPRLAQGSQDFLLQSLDLHSDTSRPCASKVCNRSAGRETRGSYDRRRGSTCGCCGSCWECCCCVRCEMRAWAQQPQQPRRSFTPMICSISENSRKRTSPRGKNSTDILCHSCFDDYWSSCLGFALALEGGVKSLLRLVYLVYPLLKIYFLVRFPTWFVGNLIGLIRQSQQNEKHLRSHC